MVRLTSQFFACRRCQRLRERLASVLALVLCACTSRAPDWPGPHHGGQTTVTVPVGGPERQIDILFVIGNSPSMAPKQTVLAQNFRKMIASLERLPAGLPEVHIGVVSSNMGAGMGALGGNCGVGLGDRGLLWGNDPNDLTASVAPGSAAAQDPNNPIVDGCGLAPGARWIEDIASPDGTDGRQRNYSGRSLEDVFTCLATAVGSRGCEEQHLLQATRVALIPQPGVNDANQGFVRRDAYLFIVLITDQDDCSASNDNTKNDDMFNLVTKLDPGDTITLRCAARGHLCGGQPIPDYDPAVGYTSSGFTHDFSDCTAKAQLDPNNPDYGYMPLIDVQEMIDSVNQVKGPLASQRIVVSGVIGWPPDPTIDTNLPATLQTSNQYQIGKDATSLSQPNLWDYMPVCWDPNQRSADGNIYKAYGGLRLRKFIISFGAWGELSSICNSDFTIAMTQVGYFWNDDAFGCGCIDAPLIDTDPNAPGVQPECQVVYRSPCTTVGTNGCLDTGWVESRLPECKDSQGNVLDPASPDLATVSEDLRPCWYVSYDNTALGCARSYNGQRISYLPASGTVAHPGALLMAECLTETATD
jgi:hypothetical protein